MLFREIIAVYSKNCTKPLNTLCGQNAEVVNVKHVVHIGATVLKGLKQACTYRKQFLLI
jgi:hypothetical protein